MKLGKNGLNVLVLYSARSLQTSAIREHLEAFAQFSKHEFFFIDAVDNVPLEFDLNIFDAIVVHYSVRLSVVNHMSEPFASAVAGHRGPKFLFIQDEYENTETARLWMERLQFDVVFTCVADRDVEKVYPRSRFPRTKFVNNLTGYVPDRLLTQAKPPIRSRPLWVGYRGRALHPIYGTLGWEKQFIGMEFQRRANIKGWPVDIEWLDKRRIYGDNWYEFLSSCRATLGTESGSNVYDINGDLRESVNSILESKPDTSYETIFESLIRPHEGRYGHMNQVSPKIFEAIALGTVLILFEGTYSNVLEPFKHYLPLKKDFSNFQQIATILSNPEDLQKIADQAYHDIVASGRYSFRVLTKMFDEALDNLKHTSKKQWQLHSMSTIAIPLSSESTQIGKVLFRNDIAMAPASIPIDYRCIETITRAWWSRYPKLIRFFAAVDWSKSAFKRPIKMMAKLYHYVPEFIKVRLRPYAKLMRRILKVSL